MTPNRRHSVRWLLVLGFVVLVSGALAATMRYGARQALEEARQVDALPVSDARTLREKTAGEPVLVEGTLAGDNPVLFRRFVAYVHHEPYVDTSGSSEQTRWRERQRFTPPLWLETPTGRVRLRNESYLIGAATGEPGELGERGPTSWKDEEGRRVWDPSNPSSGPQWYTGFEAGQAVVVAGTLASAGQLPELEASRLFGGSKADMVSSARRSARLFQVAFWVLAPLSALALLALGWLLWRRAQPPEPTLPA
jgi:hypothetical protein